MSAEKTGWVRAASRSDVTEGEVLGIEVAGHLIALYDVDGAIFATDNICTHAYARLSDGWLDGEAIDECLACADVPGIEDVRLTDVEFFQRREPWRRNAGEQSAPILC